MAMGPLKRKKTLAGRARVSKWGWSMAMGPLKRKSPVGRVRVSKWGWSMLDGHGAFEKEQNFSWEDPGV